MKRSTQLALAVTALAALSAGQALAQSLSATSSSWNAGYGRTPGDDERGVTAYGMRDENGNLIAVNGVVQSGATASAGAWAMSMGFTGAGSGSVGMIGGATAIGNNLNVTVIGNYNTVIVDSTQINTGDVTANVELNGQVDLDGHP